MATIKMKNSDGVSSVFVGGQSYAVGKKGIVEIPAEYEDTMYSFGFVTVGKNIPADLVTDDTATLELIASPAPAMVPEVAKAEPITFIPTAAESK